MSFREQGGNGLLAATVDESKCIRRFKAINRIPNQPFINCSPGLGAGFAVDVNVQFFWIAEIMSSIFIILSWGCAI